MVLMQRGPDAHMRTHKVESPASIALLKHIICPGSMRPVSVLLVRPDAPLHVHAFHMLRGYGT